MTTSAREQTTRLADLLRRERQVFGDAHMDRYTGRGRPSAEGPPQPS